MWCLWKDRAWIQESLRSFSVDVQWLGAHSKSQRNVTSRDAVEFLTGTKEECGEGEWISIQVEVCNGDCTRKSSRKGHKDNGPDDKSVTMKLFLTVARANAFCAISFPFDEGGNLVQEKTWTQTEVKLEFLKLVSNLQWDQTYHTTMKQKSASVFFLSKIVFQGAEGVGFSERSVGSFRDSRAVWVKQPNLLSASRYQLQILGENI